MYFPLILSDNLWILGKVYKFHRFSQPLLDFPEQFFPESTGNLINSLDTLSPFKYAKGKFFTWLTPHEHECVHDVFSERFKFKLKWKTSCLKILWVLFREKTKKKEKQESANSIRDKDDISNRHHVVFTGFCSVFVTRRISRVRINFPLS